MIMTNHVRLILGFTSEILVDTSNKGSPIVYMYNTSDYDLASFESQSLQIMMK